MSLTKFTKDMAIISALNDEPNDVGGMTAAELKARFDAGGKALQGYLNDTLTVETDAHIANQKNPHNVSKMQVGLGNVDNTADADKPVSALQSNALALRANRTSVLEKDNTTAYTPSLEYHPSTKKYVDDLIMQTVLGQIPDGSIATAKLAADVIAKFSDIYSSLSNKAPDGYGLGGGAPFITDCNKATACGWYACGADCANSPFQYSVMQVLMQGQDYLVQEAFTPNSEQFHARRSKNPNTTPNWSPWEWVNPPLLVGVEYRTTERRGGKPVYTKLVNCGAIANNKTVTIVGDMYRIIRTSCKGNPSLLPLVASNAIYTMDSWEGAYSCSGLDVKFYAGASLEAQGQNMEIQAWYIGA